MTTPSTDLSVRTASEPSSTRLVKVLALGLLGLVALCGLAGSCLFALVLVAPIFTQ